MPIFNIFLFVNKGHENTKTDDALVCLLSVTICLRAMCLSSVFLVSPCPPVSCVCVCVLSVLFMWHGCGYLLPAPGLPWHMVHVLIVTSSKCCGISTLSGVKLFTVVVTFIGQVLVSAPCFCLFYLCFTEGCFTKPR